jgi:hypothetical protein
MSESIEREKSRLQIEIKRLEKKPVTSFPEQLDGKRAAIAFYRSRLQALENDPERYFESNESSTVKAGAGLRVISRGVE